MKRSTAFKTVLASFAVGLAAAGGLFAPAVQAQSAKPVSLMVPYPAGGLSDAIARLVERPLGQALGRMVIVENLGGAGGSIGAQKVLGAPADGTLVYQGSPNELILAPLAMQTVRYKAEDFRFVQMIGSFPLALLVRRGLPVNSVDELVAHARKQAAAGKPLTYGSVGVGSLYHVLGAHFAEQAGAEMTHVPYKGLAPLMQDMAGDLVDVALVVVGEQQVALAEQGRLKLLATLAPKGRVEAEFLRKFPNIHDSKSIKEFAFNTWTGYFVRKDTPEQVVEALHKALVATLGDPAVKAQLEKIGGSVPAPMSLAQAAQEYQAQTARYRAIARSIKLEAQ